MNLKEIPKFEFERGRSESGCTCCMCVDDYGEYYKVEDVDKIITELLSRLEQAENLKCCGNCDNWYSEMRCPSFGEGQYASDYCYKWDSDKLTRRDRAK